MINQPDPVLLEALRAAGMLTALKVEAAHKGYDGIIPGGVTVGGAKDKTLCAFQDHDLASSTRLGQQWLEQNPDNAQALVLVYDGYITLGNWRTDALFIVTRVFSEPRQTVTIALPYQLRQGNRWLPFLKPRRPFKVYRPKFIGLDGVDEAHQPEFGDAFSEGSQRYEKGSRIWTAHLDDSR